jgi:hypothetical protein
MTRLARWALAALLLAPSILTAAEKGDPDKAGDDKSGTKAVEHFKPEQQSSTGSVTIDAQRIDYDAYAGTLVVHPKGWDDVPQNAPQDEDKNPRPEASMFYVA